MKTSKILSIFGNLYLFGSKKVGLLYLFGSSQEIVTSRRLGGHHSSKGFGGGVYHFRISTGTPPLLGCYPLIDADCHRWKGFIKIIRIRVIKNLSNISTGGRLINLIR